MTAAMSAGAATVTGGMAKASTALFAGIASLKVQAVRAGNSISIRRVDAEENQGPSAPLARPNLDEAPSSPRAKDCSFDSLACIRCLLCICIEGSRALAKSCSVC